MRQWINIAAILLESSDVLYHGTTERLWKSSGKNVNFNLYLTDDLSEARKYAEEAVKNKRDRPIVVVFKMSDLRSLPVEFEPDWGWIDALENDLKNQGKTLDQLPTWQESLSRVRSLCVSGFTDAMKRIGKAEIVEAAMLQEASDLSPDTLATFRHGGCIFFAMALHDLASWPVYAKVEWYNKQTREDGGIEHAWAINSKGQAVDIDGVHKTAKPRRGRGPTIELSDDRLWNYQQSEHYNELYSLAKQIIKQYPERFGIRALLGEASENDPHGSYGWWIFPDGSIQEMEEAGNHGWTADQWLSGHMSIPEVPYDEAIEKLIELGGVRVATFHGSDAMGIDFPPTIAPVVRNALLRLVRETRHDFNEYFIGYETVQAFDYRGIVQVIRGRP